METLVSWLSNAQVWTVALSGLAGFCGAVAPILTARYQARQAAEQAKVVIAQAAADAEAKAAAAAKEAKAAARRDAIDEWQSLYGERTKEVMDLKKNVAGLQGQNADQQSQLNVLKYQHDDCEARHAVLAKKVEVLTGSVERIVVKNGGGI